MAVLEHEGNYPIMYGRYAVPVGAGYRPGYLARPDRAGRFPVVVIVPDIDGLTSFEKDLCRAFARHGLAALTIDMYRDRSGDPIHDYHSLSDRRAMTDLDEVREFLASDDVTWTYAAAVGMLGLDVGGRFALAMAANRPWVRSVAVCYTPLAGDDEREIRVGDLLDRMPVPVLGLYGAEDDLIDVATVDEAQSRNDAGQWLLYEGAGHGFLNIEADTYHGDAAADAEQRLLQFFLQTLPVAERIETGF
ncbi:MAG TPA: dienelactone hydrolase family protein [Acidimicrobiia bacterium]|nr:dienelactone hydrolase family protein [Acidimicrobiia bacterium]